MSRDMEADDFFYSTDISNELSKPRDYDFSRPWGVPVRYHDYQQYADRVKPDFFEFHLSYSDGIEPI